MPALVPVPAPPIDVIVVDDDEVIRRVLRAVLSADPGIRVRGEAADAGAAVALANEVQPDVALIDVRMPGGGGPSATRGISRFSPNTAVLAVSAHDDRVTVVEMLRAGAVGYLVKGCSDPEILDAVRRAARGQRSLSAGVLDQVLDELGDKLAAEEHRDARTREELRRIRDLIEGDLLQMAFQPIVELGTGRTVMVEALSRFPADPVRAPDAWFAAAASVGALEELELTAVGAALSRLPDVLAGVRIAINLSPATAIRPRFAELLRDVALDQVVIEITEHAPVDDYDELSAALAPLRERGLRVAVDDAGAGFASLRHILCLEPDIVKVDMSLTRGIETHAGQRALTRALISFAVEIGATIVAEGIETASEADALRRLGANYGQGFLLGRPGPLEVAPVAGGSAPAPAEAPAASRRPRPRRVA